jgi:hypothetical protein
MGTKHSTIWSECCSDRRRDFHPPLLSDDIEEVSYLCDDIEETSDIWDQWGTEPLCFNDAYDRTILKAPKD